MLTMAQDRISFRTDPKIKEELEAVAEKLGTTTSNIMNMCAYAVVRKQGIPFGVTLCETYEERQQLSRVLEARQKVIDAGDEGNFVDHEKVKAMIGL